MDIVSMYTSARFKVSEGRLVINSYPESGEVKKFTVEFPTAGLKQDQIDNLVGEEVVGVREGTEYVLEVTAITEKNEIVFEPIEN